MSTRGTARAGPWGATWAQTRQDSLANHKSQAGCCGSSGGQRTRTSDRTRTGDQPGRGGVRGRGEPQPSQDLTAGAGRAGRAVVQRGACLSRGEEPQVGLGWKLEGGRATDAGLRAWGRSCRGRAGSAGGGLGCPPPNLLHFPVQSLLTTVMKLFKPFQKLLQGARLRGHVAWPVHSRSLSLNVVGGVSGQGSFFIHTYMILRDTYRLLNML